MKKALLTFALVLGMAMLPQVASATTFTMNQTQLLSLYEIYETPDHPGTSLNSVTSVPGGAKYVGDIGAGTGSTSSLTSWGDIMIGANFWGKPYGGSAGDEPSNVALGMGDATGYDAYSLVFTNRDENPWDYVLYMNVGYTDWSEPDYYMESAWTQLAYNETKTLTLDPTNTRVWKNGTLLGWQDVTSYGDLDWSHVSNIGFHVGANVPLGASSDDWTFETIVKPVPEPSSMLLLGIGLFGFAGRMFRRKQV